jgi:hypothetical protein
MQVRFNKSPKSTTLHFETQTQVLKLAAKLIELAESADFASGPGNSGITIFDKGQKNGYANVAVMCARRRTK